MTKPKKKRQKKKIKDNERRFFNTQLRQEINDMNETAIGKILKLAQIERKIDVIEFGIVIVGFSYLVIKAGGATTILGFSLALIFLFLTELFLMFYFKKRARTLAIEITKKKTLANESTREADNNFYKKNLSNLKIQLIIASCMLGTLFIISIIFCVLYFEAWIINRWSRPVLIFLYLLALIPQIYLFGLISSLGKLLHDQKIGIVAS